MVVLDHRKQHGFQRQNGLLSTDPAFPNHFLFVAVKSLCHSEETLLMETMTEKLKVTTSALGAQRTGVG